MTNVQPPLAEQARSAGPNFHSMTREEFLGFNRQPSSPPDRIHVLRVARQVTGL